MRTFVSSLVVATLGVTFLWYATDGLQALTSEGARRLSVVNEKTVIPDFTLETMAGELEGLRQDEKQVVIAEFIYTTCPFICQTGGSYLSRLRDQVVEQGLSDKIRIVSISFDPTVDDPSKLADYAWRHEADGKIWTVARPALQDLKVLLDSFGIVVIPDGFGGYEHNAAMHIVGPDSLLVAIVDSNDVTGALKQAERALQ